MMAPSTAKNAGTAAFQTVASALLLFVLYRFLLQALGSEQLGIWAIVLASTSIAKLSDMGFAGAATKIVAQYHSKRRYPQAAIAAQTAGVSVGLVFGLLLLPIYPTLQVALKWVISGPSISIALDILPWAVLAFWLALTSGVFLSALDGCGRMDIRNGIVLFCNCMYTGLAFLLVPKYGIEGLAVGQVLQSVGLLVLSWAMCRKQMDIKRFLPLDWRRDSFREMLSYAARFQLSTFSAMIFDPAVKYLLASFGGLTEVAYYEMANQLVARARAVLISAFQAVVPVMASTAPDDKGRHQYLYQRSSRILLAISVPYFCALGLCLPAVAVLWIGTAEITFVAFAGILCLGWLASCVGAPGYFHNIATGHLSSNTLTHVLTAILLIPLGSVLGSSHLGGVGVVIGAMVSLVLPNLLLAVLVQKRLAVSRAMVVSGPERNHVFMALVGAGICAGLYMILRQNIGDFLAAVCALSLYSSLMLSALWRNRRHLYFMRKMPW